MLELNKIYCMDCVDGMQQLEDGSIDLIFTSPPYADLRDYTKINPDGYVEWFLPKAKEMFRILKPTGNFILNINDKTVNGERHLFLHELLIKLKKEIGFMFIEEYHLKNTNAIGGEVSQKVKRFKRDFEYVYWFAKSKDFIWNPDDVMIERKTTVNNYHKSSKGIYERPNEYKQKEKKYPRGTIEFSMSQGKSGIFKNHSATFPIPFAEFWIKCGSNQNDIVLDPFMGLGTTSIACKNLNRRYLGFELSQEYIDTSNQRLIMSQNNQI